LLLLQQTAESRDWPDLPSWVPDWNKRLNHGIGSTIRWKTDFSACKSQSAKFIFLSDSKSISVRGCVVDRIARAAKNYLPTSEEDQEDFPEFQDHPETGPSWIDIACVETYLEWMEIVTSLAAYATGKNVRTTLFSSFLPLTADWVGDGFDSWLRAFLPCLPEQISSELRLSPLISVEDEGGIGNASLKGNDTIEGPPQDEEPDYDAMLMRISSHQGANTFHSLAFDFCRGTRLFLTSDGYVGRGLKAIREGDLVAVIAGVYLPIIIRKDGDVYRVKGPAYIQGIMRGEKWPDDENDLIDIILS